ncbi:MAG: porin [Candidatus Omnitrophica bacterium]|nr:porin [Candidatus Omnitrophota bacterium]
MRCLRWIYGIFLGVGLTMEFGGMAFAQVGVSPAKTLEERVLELEKEVRLLKRLLEVNQEIQIKKEVETPVVAAGKEGFVLKSKDSSFQLKLKGRVQADGRYYIADDTAPGSNTYLLRKVRPILEGTLFKYFDFRLMPDFGGGTTSLQDAFIDCKYWTEASLRLGKFKGPVGLERLQSDAYNLFPELSLVSNLVPNRDVGIDLHGDFFDSALSYDVGVFNGSADGSSNDTDIHDDKDLEARLFALPFKNTSEDWLNGLGLGVGGSLGEVHGTTASPSMPTFRTFGQQAFFSYRSDGTVPGTTIAAGRRYRIVPQFYYYYGPVGVLGEYAYSSQEAKRGNSRCEVENTAGQIAFSYVLTGENASYNGVIPRDSFDPRNGKWGGFEIATRFSWLAADYGDVKSYSNLLNSSDDAVAWGVGLNWYLNKNLKFSTAFEETFFDAGSANGKDRETENALITRLQSVF